MHRSSELRMVGLQFTVTEGVARGSRYTHTHTTKKNVLHTKTASRLALPPMPRLMSMKTLPMFCDTLVFSAAKLTPNAEAIVTKTVLMSHMRCVGESQRPDLGWLELLSKVSQV